MEDCSGRNATERGSPMNESELTDAICAAIRKKANLSYVLDCHLEAVAKHTRALAELEGELSWLKGLASAAGGEP